MNNREINITSDRLKRPIVALSIPVQYPIISLKSITFCGALDLLYGTSWISKIEQIFFDCGIPLELIILLENCMPSSLRIYVPSLIQSNIWSVISYYIQNNYRKKIRII